MGSMWLWVKRRLMELSGSRQKLPTYYRGGILQPTSAVSGTVSIWLVSFPPWSARRCGHNWGSHPMPVVIQRTSAEGYRPCNMLVISDDVRCIRNGIDLARVVPTLERSAMRAQLGIAPDTFVVGTVGRLMQR